MQYPLPPPIVPNYSNANNDSGFMEDLSILEELKLVDKKSIDKSPDSSLSQ